MWITQHPVHICTLYKLNKSLLLVFLHILYMNLINYNTPNLYCLQKSAFLFFFKFIDYDFLNHSVIENEFGPLFKTGFYWRRSFTQILKTGFYPGFLKLKPWDKTGVTRVWSSNSVRIHSINCNRICPILILLNILIHSE